MLAQRFDSKTKLKCLILYCDCFNPDKTRESCPKGGDLDVGLESGLFGGVFPLLIIYINII